MENGEIGLSMISLSICIDCGVDTDPYSHAQMGWVNRIPSDTTVKNLNIDAWLCGTCCGDEFDEEYDAETGEYNSDSKWEAVEKYQEEVWYPAVDSKDQNAKKWREAINDEDVPRIHALKEEIDGTG